MKNSRVLFLKEDGVLRVKTSSGEERFTIDKGDIFPSSKIKGIVRGKNTFLLIGEEEVNIKSIFSAI